MENHVRSTSFIKKAIALLCVMFTIVGLFGYYNMKPLSSNALASYVSYTVGMGGGTKYYSNSSVGKFTSSASWISVTRTSQSNFTIRIAESAYISSSPQRYGYVNFYNSKGTLLYRMTINQTNPYIDITSRNVTIPNEKNGIGYVTVQSNISFYYEITNDTKGRLYQCNGGQPNTAGTLKTYSFPVQTRNINRSEIRWSFNFQVRAAKYTYWSVRNCTLYQESEPYKPSFYTYSGSYGTNHLKFSGPSPSSQNAVDTTYEYNVLKWEMPAIEMETPDGKEIDYATLKRSALSNYIEITMKAKSNQGELFVYVNGYRISYARVEKTDTGDLNIIVHNYGSYNNDEIVSFYCTQS